MGREKGRKMDKAEYFNNVRRGKLAKYGITEDDYDALLASQRGRCAICGKDASGNGRLLAVDHDHKTGEVRGLLCRGCNLGIGLLEKEGFLNKAMAYLANPHDRA
jgi:hypothetical protein